MASIESQSRILRRRQKAAAGLPIAVETRPISAPSSGASVIEFRGVSKRYPSGDVGLDQVTFSIDRGEFVFPVGATGSGKSTLMRLLIKELRPTGGTIRVANHGLGEIRRKRMAFDRRNIGVVFQDFKL